MNTIKIKHGSGVPEGKLQPYELGICDDDGMLYIGVPNGEGAVYPLNNHLPLTGGTIEGNLVVEGYIDASCVDVYEYYSNGYEGTQVSSWCGIKIYAAYEDDIIDWDKGLHYYFDNNDSLDSYLGSISMFGTNNYVDCVYIGKSADEAWLKIIPEVGIQTDSIILKPYDVNTGKGSFGYENPNDANIPGIPGQLYFVITG